MKISKFHGALDLTGKIVGTLASCIDTVWFPSHLLTTTSHEKGVHNVGVFIALFASTVVVLQACARQRKARLRLTIT